MSSTWVAEFSNEEDYDHFVARFSEIAPNGGNIIVPETPLNPDKVRLRGAYVDLTEEVYVYDEERGDDEDYEPAVKDPAWAVSFEIAIWDDWTKSFIKALMQEMCHRYSFVEIGCTSTELISSEEFMTWELFTNHTLLFQIFEKYGTPDDTTPEDIEKIKQGLKIVEKTFRAAAKRFFDGDASDLILAHEKEGV